MKRPAQILLLALCATLTAVGQSPRNAKTVAKITDFEIDANRPYVYLEVDHVGPREPLHEGEPNVGIYLRLKNNCRLPIVIVALEAPPADPKAAISIEDEVVPDPHGPGGDAGGGGVYVQSGIPGLSEMDDIVRWPNATEAEVRGAERAQQSASKCSKSALLRPHGYNGVNVPGSRMITLIPPDGQVFFSVPANHVGPTWHFEIPFRFPLPRKAVRQPYSFLVFYQEDLDGAQGNAAVPATH